MATVTNGRYFSYPGYNEILTGFGDPAIDSHDKVNNPKVTVLEWLDDKPALQGRPATQGQFSATVARLLGYDFCESEERIAPSLDVSQ